VPAHVWRFASPDRKTERNRAIQALRRSRSAAERRPDRQSAGHPCYLLGRTSRPDGACWSPGLPMCLALDERISLSTSTRLRRADAS